jgi:hypothetical protein
MWTSLAMHDWLGLPPPAPFGQIQIRGKKFRVIFTDSLDEKHDANVDPPGTPYRTIYIRPHIAHDPHYLLEIMLHEALHGAFWDLSEEVVGEVAKDFAKIAVKTLGYRPTVE